METGKPMFDYKMEHLFSYSATLQAPPEVIGPVAEGLRVNFHITGGRVRGARFDGRVRAVGTDSFLLRRDGVGLLDVRTTMEAADGALIDVAYQGIGDLGEDGYERFLRGELPPTLALRTGPRLRTAHPAYQWLQRLYCVGVGAVDFARSEVSYDVYAVR
ncbi:MAG: DUF3237 domain-containing protein [Nevskia sp.]|nr:DUF3237 domain-containing protein [Nevskia sp.]